MRFKHLAFLFVLVPQLFLSTQGRAEYEKGDAMIWYPSIGDEPIAIGIFNSAYDETVGSSTYHNTIVRRQLRLENPA